MSQVKSPLVNIHLKTLLVVLLLLQKTGFDLISFIKEIRFFQEN